MPAYVRAPAPTESCRAELSRADGSGVVDQLLIASAAALRHLDQVRWCLPDGDYIMRIVSVADATA